MNLPRFRAKRSFIALSTLLIFFVGFFSGPASLATLGGDPSSIETVRQAISGQRRQPVAHAGGYSVYEIVASAVTVREYVSNDGVIFGVAWNGRVHPDLVPLLGSYLAEYQGSLRAPSAQATLGGMRLRRSRSSVRGPNVIVERSGHMRSLRGRAYLPTLLPGGVNANEIE